MTQALEEPSTKPIQNQLGLAELAWMNNSQDCGDKAAVTLGLLSSGLYI